MNKNILLNFKAPTRNLLLEEADYTLTNSLIIF